MKLVIWIVAGVLLWWLMKGGRKSRTAMSKADAAKLLGLSPDADPEAIIAAHKRLITKVHPDSGGSAELASQINRARDVLLTKIGQ
jgi:DnaJ homolog subfamily C member 19